MDTKIKVIVRCRPSMPDESRHSRRAPLTLTSDTISVGDKRFQFEHVLGENSSQVDVYNLCVKSLVDGCFEGYNATIFAYGQTGSGKTHSIMGPNTSTGDDEESGIIPRAILQIFDYLNSDPAKGRMASVRVSMIELYNDECKDLLHPEIPSRDIMIREDKHGRIFFTGAREEVVSNTSIALQYLEQGNINRSTAETLMNQASSRSHAIFTISLEMLEYSEKGIVDEDSSFIHAKLHLVDLAGSERAKKTGASGTRLKESVGINQGLLSLGKVIRALTTHPVTHVPYRESKLTRFLQDSLGGNSRTVLLACISPSEYNLHETVNTLQYAQRAKSIHNRIMANVTTGVASSELQAELESSLVVSLRAEIQRMQKEMSVMNTEKNILPTGNTINDNSSGSTIKNLESKVHNYVQVLRNIRDSLQSVMKSKSQIDGALLLSACEKILRISFEVLQKDNSTTKSSELSIRRSLRESLDGLRVAAGNRDPLSQDKEIENLRQELEDCKEDLKRDEEIFAEKMKELKKIKKQLKDVEAENDTLKNNQDMLKNQLVKLSKLPKLFMNQGVTPISATNTPVKQRPQEGNRNDTEDIPDDLDVSIAVAMTEPDISQLMEDFETVYKEKEDLLSSYRSAEEKIKEIEEAAKFQRDKVLKSQATLQQKLKSKDDLLSDRNDEIRALRDEISTLKEDIADLDYERQKLLEDIDSLSSKNSFRREETFANQGEKIESLAETVRLISEEKNTLVLKLRESEMEKERAARDYRKEQSDLRSQIERIRKTKDELQSDLERLTEGNNSLSLQLQEKSEALAAAMKTVEHAEREAKAAKANAIPSQAKAPKELSIASLNSSLRSSQSNHLSSWLDDRLDDIVKEGVSQLEILRLQKALSLIVSDKESATKELRSKRSSLQQSNDPNISSKIKSIEEKIRSLKLKAAGIRVKLQQEPRNDALKSELREIEYSMQTYEEHRSEYEDRLSKDLNSPEIQELVDDIDAMDAEMSSIANRIRQEKDNLGAIQEMNQKRFGASRGTDAADEKGAYQLGRSVKALVQELKVFYLDLLKRSRSGGEQATDLSETASDGSVDFDSLLSIALKLHIKARVKSGSSEASWKESKNQLELKCSEYDNLVKTMQKMRNEAIRKQEQIRKESEEKISFLVQQIRTLENRSPVTVLDAHSDRPSSSSSSYSQHYSHLHAGVQQQLFKGTDSAPNSRPASSSASRRMIGSSEVENSIIGTLRGRQMPRKSTSELLQQLDDPQEDNVNQEVLKRWVSEKERREQLEKRNAELARELRTLRSSIKADA